MKFAMKSVLTLGLLAVALGCGISDAEAQSRRPGGPPPPTADQTIELSASYGNMWGGNFNIRHGKILGAVTIKLPDANRGTDPTGAVSHRALKAAVAISQQHRDIVTTLIRHCQVRFSVSIKVADGNR